MDYRLDEYDKKRLEEMRRVNLPLFWIPFFVVGFAVVAYLFFASGG